MNWEAKAKLTAESDQIISALSEPEVVVELKAFADMVRHTDSVLENMGLNRSSRMNAIAGGVARCLLEKYGESTT